MTLFIKSINRDGGSIKLYAAYTVDTVDTFDTVDMVCTFDMVYTVDMLTLLTLFKLPLNIYG